MPIQKLETTNVLKEWMDTINTIIDNSSEVESLLDKKVDKETGKGLSSNDFTNTLKNKLDGIEEGANNYSLPTASDSTKGGVTLSDSTSSESGVSDGIAATPKAVKSAYDLASSALPKSGGTITGDLIVTGKINATIEGNTDSANKLSTPRTIALTGDVSGSTTFDGSKDVSITVTVADDSHSHTVENIDNLETMLATKAGTTSPTFNGTPKAPTATAGTNTTQIATTAFVQNAIDSKIAASDAMIFKGTIGTSGTITELPATHTTGWTYKVITADTYAGISCEIGDMIVCLADGTVASDDDWTVIQTNIDGAVTGPASAVTGQIAVFDGATGKTIKDSGFTIATSVPPNAVFTDTTYTGADGITLTGTKFTNSGVRSISSGATNGTISVNTNGTSAEVAVKGLGSAAYTASGDYTPISHITATDKNIGVIGDASTYGHVKLSDDITSNDNSSGVAATPKAVKSAYDLASAALPKAGGTITGDLTVEGTLTANIEGKASTASEAEKLTTPRTIALTGDVSGSTTFDGSDDVSITVTVADDSHSHTVENIDNLETMLASKANIASPTFTGTPKAPTAAEGTNSTQIATTAFVTTAVKNQATTDASNYATKSELTSLEESLATVATTGNYNDLTGTPTSLKNPTSLTLQNSAGTSIGTYDGSTATTVKLTSATVGLGNVTNESKATMFTNAALTGTPTAPTATSETNTTQIATTAFVQSVVDSKIAAADAMIYKGTIGTGGTVTTLPNTHSTGWTYKVITAGTYAGVECNVGDMIICLTDGTDANNAHWTVVEGNIDGAVTGPVSSVANHVAIFDGATGKVIKDSGFSIAKSVPSNAEFTDTTYTVGTTSYSGTTKLYTESGSNTDGTITQKAITDTFLTKQDFEDYKNTEEVVEASEAIWTVTESIPENTIVNIPNGVVYPYNKNAIRVSVDGLILSKNVNYEEVSSSGMSSQIKFLFNVDANSVIQVWVAPQAEIKGSWDFIQSSVETTAQNVELCQQFADSIDTSKFVRNDINGTINANLSVNGVLTTTSAVSLIKNMTDNNIDVSSSNVFTKTITENTTFTISGVVENASSIFTLILTNGGNYAVTWPSSVKWADGTIPELTADGKDILTFITVDGVTWYGSPSIINAM